MQFRTILTLITLGFGAVGVQTPGYAASNLVAPRNLFLDMRDAFTQGHTQRLGKLAPLVKGQLLEPWAAYWELKARLETADAKEVNAFFKRYAGTYQEDRLRNDWLLLLGKNKDWSTFAEQASQFRMQDDRQVRCYTLAMENILTKVNMADEVKTLWFQQKNEDEGCALAAQSHFERRQLSSKDIWQKVYLATEAHQLSAARQAATMVESQSSTQVAQVLKRPERFLAQQTPSKQTRTQQLALLALIRWADSKPDSAAQMLSTRWSKYLSAEQRDWAWSVIGKQSAQNLSDDAMSYFSHVKPNNMRDEHLAWRVRAALRVGQWRDVIDSVDAMQTPTRQDSTWVYWRARARLKLATSEPERQQARADLQSIASMDGFYEILATEALGQALSLPAGPPPPTESELQMARDNPGLQRALAAFDLGLRSEAVREWNYTTNMHEAGGMNDRALLAAAQLACINQVWDRCINTSERTKSFIDVKQRFPMPHEQAVLAQSKAIGLDPAYVYGLIRQESRFIMDARSHVGASGLMQVMPKTAVWTAKKIGMGNFTTSQLKERDVNIAIGTGYLKLVLDAFDGSMPMAAAAYNAGPSRSRSWRTSANPEPLEAAIWMENIPFSETRNYVKKVLANTTVYAAVISGQSQSLQARLGVVSPKGERSDVASRDLP